MKLYIINHPFHFEAENLCRLFYPDEKIEKCTEDGPLSGIDVWTGVREQDGQLTYCVRTENITRTGAGPSDEEKNEREYRMMALLFEVLQTMSGYHPRWGMLTGVRPAKLMNHLAEELGEEQARTVFEQKYLVDADKAELASRVARREREITGRCARNAYSFYAAVPFCPSRCSYCSFVSHSIANAGKLIEPYTDLLCREIELTGKIAGECGLALESVYIGGGTPTVLSAGQISRVTQAVADAFGTDIREFTFEAGRPDTITAEKLAAARAGGVNRISINPQTFNDDVLRRIGRKHTADQTVAAYELARGFDFADINMDIIAGLPGDTIESFANTMDTAIALGPSNITVHTLALKRSSTLVERREDVRAGALLTDQMLELAQSKLYQAGYEPYYMYRQSRSLGNLENVGWSRLGRECTYNIYMMEESHTVLAAGAGSVTKLKDPDSDHLERIFNYKYPYEYIHSFDEMIRRKDRIIDFCRSYL